MSCACAGRRVRDVRTRSVGVSAVQRINRKKHAGVLRKRLGTMNDERSIRGGTMTVSESITNDPNLAVPASTVLTVARLPGSFPLTEEA